MFLFISVPMLAARSQMGNSSSLKTIPPATLLITQTNSVSPVATFAVRAGAGAAEGSRGRLGWALLDREDAALHEIQ